MPTVQPPDTFLLYSMLLDLSTEEKKTPLMYGPRKRTCTAYLQKIFMLTHPLIVPMRRAVRFYPIGRGAQQGSTEFSHLSQIDAGGIVLARETCCIYGEHVPAYPSFRTRYLIYMSV